MSVPSRHILQQGPVLAAIGRAAVTTLKEQMNGVSSAAPTLPGPEIVETLSPRPRDLIRDYVRNVGGDTGRYKKTLPPHMFPQWSFPIASKTLKNIPYPLIKVVNGGCRIEINAPIPAGESLTVRGQLVGIDENESRAVLHQRIVTSTDSVADALISHLYAIVPVAKSNGASKKKRKEKPRVPTNVRELLFTKIRADAGLDFAKLTGDFNPIHWIPAYAKASGFRRAILHGFATMARAFEGLNNTVVAPGQRISMMDVKFTRPLLLPSKVGLYVDDQGGVFVGDAPGGPAYLVGQYEVTNA